LVALWRSRRPATWRHPFGFGKEQFFWALLAAIAIFVTGAVVAVTEGVRALIVGERELSDIPLALGILGLAALADRASLFRVVSQLRAEARQAGATLVGHVRRTTDPTARTVLLEDGAGLRGVALAAAGLGLHQLTGDPRWDAGASIAVGVVLVGIAFEVGRDSKSLLLGEGADLDELAALRAVFGSHGDAVDLVDLLTMRLGPTTCWSPPMSIWSTASPPRRSSGWPTASSASSSPQFPPSARCSSTRDRDPAPPGRGRGNDRRSRTLEAVAVGSVDPAVIASRIAERRLLPRRAGAGGGWRTGSGHERR
jgi:cation diffusion facilitator family transporter